MQKKWADYESDISESSNDEFLPLERVCPVPPKRVLAVPNIPPSASRQTLPRPSRQSLPRPSRQSLPRPSRQTTRRIHPHHDVQVQVHVGSEQQADNRMDVDVVSVTVFLAL